jgi:hypothetical protein
VRVTFRPPLCHCVICWIYVDNDYPDPLVGRWNGLVREHGWTAVEVGGDGSPGWAHTIGLWHSYRLPEIVVFGFPYALPLLKFLVDQILAGQEMPEGTTIDISGSDLPAMTLKEVVPGWDKAFLGAAMGFYRQTPTVPFLQVSHGGDEPRLWLSTEGHPDDHWRAQLSDLPDSGQPGR